MLRLLLRRFCTTTVALDEEFLEVRNEFLRMEALRESVVDFDKLTDDEKLIYGAHKAAVENFHFTYDDPLDGSRHFTRYRHSLIGRCCGTACRHCIFNYSAVPEILKSNRRFNTSFWIPKDPSKSSVIELFQDLKVSDEVIRKKN